MPRILLVCRGLLLQWPGRLCDKSHGSRSVPAAHGESSSIAYVLRVVQLQTSRRMQPVFS